MKRYVLYNNSGKEDNWKLLYMRHPKMGDGSSIRKFYTCVEDKSENIDCIKYSVLKVISEDYLYTD